MKLSTGKKPFKIEFDNGETETIYFNPNDPSLSIRMRDFQGKMDKRIAEIDDIKLDAEGKPTDTSVIDSFEKVQTALFEEFDTAFNGDISSKLFKYCSPFAVVDGNYFIINFLDAIVPEIQKEIQKSNKKASDNMQKHIAKYTK